MKAGLVIFLLLVVHPTAVLSAPVLPLCADTVEIDGNCTIVTPIVSTCSNYTYNILNTSSGLDALENTSLIQLNQSIYYFNFTQPSGDYLVRICDGTTREVRVVGDDVTYATGIAIIFVSLLGMIGAISFFVANQRGQTDRYVELLLTGLKFLIVLTIPWFIVLGTSLATNIAEDANASAAVVSLLNTFYRIVFYLSWLYMVIMFIIAAIMMFNWLLKVPGETQKVFRGGER